MDSATIKKWVIFFLGILVAIIIANWLSNVIVAYAGMTGWMNFVVSFVLYAVLFFAILYVMEKLFGIEFFGFGRARIVKKSLFLYVLLSYLKKSCLFYLVRILLFGRTVRYRLPGLVCKPDHALGIRHLYTGRFESVLNPRKDRDGKGDVVPGQFPVRGKPDAYRKNDAVSGNIAHKDCRCRVFEHEGVIFKDFADNFLCLFYIVLVPDPDGIDKAHGNVCLVV